MRPASENLRESTLAAVTSSVASAVGLDEGPPGVRAVLRELARREPVSIRALSQATGLPVPLVAAMCNELRALEVVSAQRPAALTDRGRELTAAFRAPALEAACDVCDGLGLRLTAELTEVVDVVARIEAEAPPARLELDQAHCTPETKVLRALLLQEAGALAGAKVFLAGDDDLLSLTIGVLAERSLVHPPDQIAVVDVDPDLVSFIAERGRELSTPIEATTHDLRDPLPGDLVGRFDCAFTDPPYTVPGARLFLSRCVEALADGPGRDVFLAFGPKGPDIALGVQRTFSEMGLVARRMLPGFNEYRGAGILGGRSDMFHLVSSASTHSGIEGHYAGEMYTADRGRAPRRYVCTSCGSEYLVGTGADFASVRELQERGCSACGGVKFRPGTLVGEQR